MIKITFVIDGKTQEEIVETFNETAEEMPPVDGQPTVEIRIPDTDYHWVLDARKFYDKHSPGAYERIINAS